MAAVVDDAVTGVRVVKGFGQEARNSASSTAWRSGCSARGYGRPTHREVQPGTSSIPALGQVGVLALGGYLAVKGTISLGTFLAFSTYLAQLVGPVRMLSNLITIGQQARASVIRVYEVIDSRPIVTERPGAVELPRTGRRRSPRRRDVRLRASQPVLRGLSLHVAPGETVALVGHVGLRQVDAVDAAAALLRRAGRRGTRRRHRCPRPDDRLDPCLDRLRDGGQLPVLRVGPANIAYGRPDATDEQIIAAAKAAEAHDFIAALPNGYDTLIGEQGLTLSGRPRQRVSLARALITDPRILMLDDATSPSTPASRPKSTRRCTG